jgi:hypothetical protein
MQAIVNPFLRTITIKVDDYSRTLSYNYNDLDEIDQWWDLTVNGKKYTIHAEYCDGLELGMYAYHEKSNSAWHPGGTVDFGVNLIKDYSIEYKIWKNDDSIEISLLKSELVGEST